MISEAELEALAKSYARALVEPTGDHSEGEMMAALGLMVGALLRAWRIDGQHKKAARWLETPRRDCNLDAH